MSLLVFDYSRISCSPNPAWYTTNNLTWVSSLSSHASDAIKLRKTLKDSKKSICSKVAALPKKHQKTSKIKSSHVGNRKFFAQPGFDSIKTCELVNKWNRQKIVVLAKLKVRVLRQFLFQSYFGYEALIVGVSLYLYFFKHSKTFKRLVRLKRKWGRS